MPSEPILSVTGQVTDLFGHRFVIQTSDDKILADLGPKGAQEIGLTPGDEVTLTGERKPSEVKVHSLTVAGRTFVLKSGKDESGHSELDEGNAFAVVTAAGYEPIGPAKRKPKHFEILGRRGNSFAEFHVELDGSLRKAQPINDPTQVDRP